jgi:hypothetical protein
VGEAKKKGLRVAEGVLLPLDYVTKTCAILAQRRKGKTYLGCDLAEELAAAELPWVALDPTGAWWGLRSSADGKHAGLPVVVIGGQHGDLPLERDGGAVIADLVLDHPGWYVLDLSLLESRAAEREFTATFGDRLHRRKMQPGMDFPLHLFVDEADLFVPQEKETTWNSGRGSRIPDVLAVYGGIVRRGGLHGLGSTLISQRPALINKNALTQIDLLFLLRLVAGQDQDAVYKNNVSRFLPKTEALALMATLATLPIGEGWILEPGADPPTVERVRFRERQTFNSSATPKPGERRVEPSVFAEIDLDELRAGMESAIERARQDDPAELRRRLRAAEDRAHGLDQLVEEWKQRAENAAALAAAAVEPERVEVPVFTVGDLDEIWKLVQATKDTGEQLTATLREVAQPLAEAILRAAEAAENPRVPVERPAPPPPPRPAPPVRIEANANANANGDGDVKLKAGARRMVEMLGRLHPEPLTRVQLGTLADITPTSGTFSDYLSSLRRAGLVDDASDGRVALTQAGLDAAAAHVGLGSPSPAELKEMWSRKFKAGARRMLDELFAVYPDGLTRDELSDRAEITKSSGTFSDYLSSLRRNKIIVERDGSIYAGDALFLGSR